MKKVLALLMGVFLVPALGASASSVTEDFESGFGDRDAYVNGLMVIELGSWGSAINPLVSQRGGSTAASFIAYDKDSNKLYDDLDNLPPGTMGDYFLSNRTTTGRVWDFYFTFFDDVTSLTLDLYDYADGAGGIGDYATLNLFDANMDLIGTQTYYQSVDEEDTSMLGISVLALSGTATYASLRLGDGGAPGRDFGLGVDNIMLGIQDEQFQLSRSQPFSIPSVPEPATMSLLGLGAAGLALTRIRRKR